MKRLVPTVLAFVLWVAAAVGAELKVGTLNCYLLFDPAVQHPGKLDDKEKMTLKEYREKLGNLASLMSGYQVVALEETGGRAEVQALATAAAMEWAWRKGRDTATGEEVGFLYRLPEWKMVSHGRVPELDSVVSKHLLVTLAHGSERIHFWSFILFDRSARRPTSKLVRLPQSQRGSPASRTASPRQRSLF